MVAAKRNGSLKHHRVPYLLERDECERDSGAKSLFAPQTAQNAASSMNATTS